METPGFHYHFRPKHDVPLIFVGALLVTAIFWLLTLISHHRTPMPYQSAGITAQWIPSTVKRWQVPVNTMAKRYNIDPNYVAIIMTMESGGNAKAKSEAGAEGLMQITAPTAKDIASKYLKTPVQHYDLSKPSTNIEFGVAYLAHLRNIFGNYTQGPEWYLTSELVAAGYNGGPGAAGRAYRGEGLIDTQTVVYARDAFNMWRERFAKDSPTFDRWKERGGSTLLDTAKSTPQPSL
jgi:soluble lytic murein transglycosylase-like protein